MAKRSRPSKTRTTLLGGLITFVCGIAIPFGPSCLGCELDTTPRRPPVIKPSPDDGDSGEERNIS